jgi:hypothetical protein
VSFLPGPAGPIFTGYRNDFAMLAQSLRALPRLLQSIASFARLRAAFVPASERREYLLGQGGIALYLDNFAWSIARSACRDEKTNTGTFGRPVERALRQLTMIKNGLSRHRRRGFPTGNPWSHRQGSALQTEG